MAARRNVLSVIQENSGLLVFGFRLGDLDLVPVGTPAPEQFVQCLHWLMRLERHVDFWIGDLLVWGELRWGKAYKTLVEATGYDYGTLRNLKWVASRVPASERRMTLSFSHHEEVADLAPSQRQQLLDRAEQENWTRRQVREEAYRVARTAARPQQLTLDPHLYHGDCRELVAALPNSSVDLLLTDPPYGIDYESPARIVPFPRMADDNQNATALLDDALLHMAPKLKPEASVCVFTSRKTLREMVAVVENHFPMRSIISYRKQAWGIGDLEANWGDQHELVIFAGRGSRRHLPSRAIHCDRVGSNQLQHPTQKPLALLHALIGELTDPGDAVLDPFMGSGSTCLAARRSARRYWGIELEEQWYNVALRRLASDEEE